MRKDITVIFTEVIGLFKTLLEYKTTLSIDLDAMPEPGKTQKSARIYI